MPNCKQISVGHPGDIKIAEIRKIVRRYPSYLEVCPDQTWQNTAPDQGLCPDHTWQNTASDQGLCPDQTQQNTASDQGLCPDQTKQNTASDQGLTLLVAHSIVFTSINRVQHALVHWRQFAWNVKTCVLRKIRKIL